MNSFLVRVQFSQKIQVPASYQDSINFTLRGLKEKTDYEIKYVQESSPSQA